MELNMPYPNEHAARIKNPDLFENNSFRRKVIDTGINIIIGKLTGGDGSMVVQAYRFDVTYFTAPQAKKWLKDHDIEYMSFEAATKESNFEPTARSIGNDPECRIVNNVKCQFDKRYDDKGDHTDFISGVGIVYNTEIELWPGFFESIQPGAFSHSLNKFQEVKCFINHDSSKVLSTTKSNPALEITDNDDSLNFRSPIPPTTYGNDLAVNVERGNISGASFSFTINDDGDKYTIDNDGNYHRVITNAEIYEVGPVTNPAYQQTSVALRNKEQLMDKVRKQTPEPDKTLEEITEFLSIRKGL